MKLQNVATTSSSLSGNLVTILVVDDESLIRELLEKSLRGYRVLKAVNGDEALRIYEREKIDLVLTDVMMPGRNGIDLLRKIKEIDPNAVVIIMTGFGEKDVVLSALRAHADDFINKPLNLLQLKTAVEKALNHKALKEELANLKKLDHLKSNFLSIISHKLKTPLTAISLFLQNIQTGVLDHSDPAFQQNANLMFGEATYLGRLVSDLLVFSQVMVGSEGLELVPCDLAEIARTALQSSSERLGKPGLETDFSSETLHPMMLDCGKITFALSQVIDNACKFSGIDGVVSVAVKKAGDTACIQVADNGIGIPKDEIAKVFEKFYQIDPDNTGQVRGFGLGLYYAREFVRMHGGSISIDSEPGLGTIVTISLLLQ